MMWCLYIVFYLYLVLNSIIIFVFQQVKTVIYKQFLIIMFLIKMLEYFLYIILHVFISFIISLITIVCIYLFFLHLIIIYNCLLLKISYIIETLFDIISSVIFMIFITKYIYNINNCTININVYIMYVM